MAYQSAFPYNTDTTFNSNYSLGYFGIVKLLLDAPSGKIIDSLLALATEERKGTVAPHPEWTSTRRHI
jgi:hypothetical protein